jgi:cysteine desulfurase
MEASGSTNSAGACPVTGPFLFTAVAVLGAVYARVSKKCRENQQQQQQQQQKAGGAVAVENRFDRDVWKANLNKKFGSCVYLDYNASTPVFPEVGEAMLPFITTCFGNPSSGHPYARPCREAVAEGRRLVAELINAPNPAETIFFTSCGTESDNWGIEIALHHFATRNSSVIPRVVTCSVEHPAIMGFLKLLESKGRLELVVVGVDTQGFVQLQDLVNALTVDTALVTIMHSNNEIGTLQPIRDISRIIETYNNSKGAHILFHVDAAQSIGKVPVGVAGVDLMSVVGHKFGAPKGIGALYVKSGIK